MPTECTPDFFGFEPVEGREVVAAFDAGSITSDAGALLLGATDRAIKMMDRFASCLCQLDLYADRTSTAAMRGNQLRLWFASMAYVLLCALRRIGLHHTHFAKATCGTIRLKLLKIGALVRVSVRRIKVAMASGCPALIM